MPFGDPPHCGEPMNLVRLIPRLGVLPELHVFYCERCGKIQTIEQPPERAARTTTVSAPSGDR
jgi:Fe2+ or Zn2+ uptake regulation protein